MLNKWKAKYYELLESSHQERLILRGQVKGLQTILEVTENEVRLLRAQAKLSDLIIRALRILLDKCCNARPPIAIALSLEYSIDSFIIKSPDMVTAPVGRFCILTIRGLDTNQKEGPLTEIEASSTDPSVLLVEPVLDTDGTTPIPNQRKVTTLKEGTASISATAKNSVGALLSATEDWTVANEAPVIVATSLVFGYSDLQDVPATA